MSSSLSAAASSCSRPGRASRGRGRCRTWLRAHLERAGTPIGPNEMLIAAHALALGLIVVSGNDREFARVPGLAVENWLA